MPAEAAAKRHWQPRPHLLLRKTVAILDSCYHYYSPPRKKNHWIAVVPKKTSNLNFPKAGHWKDWEFVVWLDAAAAAATWVLLLLLPATTAHCRFAVRQLIVRRDACQTSFSKKPGFVFSQTIV